MLLQESLCTALLALSTSTCHERENDWTLAVLPTSQANIVRSNSTTTYKLFFIGLLSFLDSL